MTPVAFNSSTLKVQRSTGGKVCTACCGDCGCEPNELSTCWCAIDGSNGVKYLHLVASDIILCDCSFSIPDPNKTYCLEWSEEQSTNARCVWLASEDVPGGTLRASAVATFFSNGGVSYLIGAAIQFGSPGSNKDIFNGSVPMTSLDCNDQLPLTLNNNRTCATDGTCFHDIGTGGTAILINPCA